MKLAQKLVELAKREIGVQEVDGTNCGVKVDIYKSATNLPPHESWPWCAAFICWLVQEVMLAGVMAGEKYTFKRPTTAGAFDFENWSRRQDNSTQTRRPAGTDILPGDIIIFNFSHIGLALTGPDDAGMIGTIEGNTDSAGSREGGGVFAKRRKLSSIRSRIRFTV